jgi:hypothetical protein
MNAIENLWGILKEKLRSVPAASTLNDLEALVKNIWTQDHALHTACERLSDSMPTRVAELISNAGGATHY